MTAKETIEALMKESGINQTQLAALVGMKNQSNVSETLKRDIKISVFVRFINALGYEVAIQKKIPGYIRENQRIVSFGTEE